MTLVGRLLEIDPTFLAPHDYVPPKKSKKIYLPDDGTNYIGLLIGPQGKTQKMLEMQSGCKIQLRGRGANAKRKTYDIFEQDENEELHVLITGNSYEDIESCVIAMEPLLDPNSSHKQNQLMEYAAI